MEELTHALITAVRYDSRHLLCFKSIRERAIDSHRPLLVHEPALFSEVRQDLTDAAESTQAPESNAIQSSRDLTTLPGMKILFTMLASKRFDVTFAPKKRPLAEQMPSPDTTGCAIPTCLSQGGIVVDEAPEVVTASHQKSKIPDLKWHHHATNDG